MTDQTDDRARLIAELRRDAARRREMWGASAPVTGVHDTLSIIRDTAEALDAAADLLARDAARIAELERELTKARESASYADAYRMQIAVQRDAAAARANRALVRAHRALVRADRAEGALRTARRMLERIKAEAEHSHTSHRVGKSVIAKMAEQAVRELAAAALPPVDEQASCEADELMASMRADRVRRPIGDSAAPQPEEWRRLRPARIAARVFMSEMAKALGVPVPYLSDVELGKQPMPSDWPQRYAEVIAAKRTAPSQPQEDDERERIGACESCSCALYDGDEYRTWEDGVRTCPPCTESDDAAERAAPPQPKGA